MLALALPPSLSFIEPAKLKIKIVCGSWFLTQATAKVLYQRPDG
jgi:hypothetical protein